eukprot:3087669-Rhodomonas_salina.1
MSAFDLLVEAAASCQHEETTFLHNDGNAFSWSWLHSEHNRSDFLVRRCQRGGRRACTQEEQEGEEEQGTPLGQRRCDFGHRCCCRQARKQVPAPTAFYAPATAFPGLISRAVSTSFDMGNGDLSKMGPVSAYARAMRTPVLT